MKNKQLSLSVVLLLITFLSGCKVAVPPAPVESYIYNPVKPETSVINLHADLETSKLENILNSHIDTLIYEDKSLSDNEGDNLIVKAWKNGWIKVSCQNDQLSWEVPLKISLKKAVAVFAFNLPFVDAMEAKGEIKIRFKTRLAVNPDWSITTTTTPDGYDWVKKPSVKFSGVTIPVTPIADVMLKSNLADYSKQIDQTISSAFDLRKYAENGWKMLFNPFKVPGDYNAWITVKPYAVSLMPVKGSEGFIRFRMAVSSDVECLLDHKPEPSKPTGLPVLKPLEMATDSFRLNMLTDIPYSTIERMTLEQVSDSVYTFGNRKIKFETMRVYGTNGKMAIETMVSGSINGTMYLTGTPYFNSSDTTIRVKDLKFDLKTRNIMMKSADWLFNGKIERTITRAFAIPFNSDVKEIERQLTGYLNHYQLGYGLEVNGLLSKMTVSDVLLTPESVKANVVFSGKLSFGIGELTTPSKR